MNEVLPDKYLPLEDSYLGLGSRILEQLKRPYNVVELWRCFKKDVNFASYDRFIITLGVLYRVGLITYDNKQLRRAK